MPVLSRTSAIEDMQHRDGSIARNPHSSSRLNPLECASASLVQRDNGPLPHAQHINQMLLRNIILFMDIALQGSEDIPLLDNALTTSPFDFEKCWVRNAVLIGQCLTVLWRNGEVLKFLPENYDGLFI